MNCSILSSCRPTCAKENRMITVWWRFYSEYCVTGHVWPCWKILACLASFVLFFTPWEKWNITNFNCLIIQVIILRSIFIVLSVIFKWQINTSICLNKGAIEWKTVFILAKRRVRYMDLTYCQPQFLSRVSNWNLAYQKVGGNSKILELFGNSCVNIYASTPAHVQVQSLLP